MSSDIACCGTEHLYDTGFKKGRYKCNGKGYIILKYLYPDEPDLDTPHTVAVCPCMQQKQEGRKLSYILQKLGEPIASNLKPNQTEALARFKNSGHRNLYLHGESRAGKTMLIKYIAKDIIKPIKIFTSMELKEHIYRKSIDSTLDSMEKTFSSCMILDDLDKINPSDSFSNWLMYLIDQTDKQFLDLIITSNIKPDDLLKKFNILAENLTAMLARLKEKFCIIEMGTGKKELFG